MHVKSLKSITCMSKNEYTSDGDAENLETRVPIVWYSKLNIFSAYMDLVSIALWEYPEEESCCSLIPLISYSPRYGTAPWGLKYWHNKYIG